MQANFPEYALIDISDIRGKSVVDLAPFLRTCDVLITIDSALLHLAYATGTPTIALSRPLEWYMSEPRFHWVARYTYDEAMRPDVREKIAGLLRLPLEQLRALRGSLCRKFSPPDPTRHICHAVDWFRGSGETARRHEFARTTWDNLHATDSHWSIFVDGKYSRSSLSIGDSRQLPFVKDVIDGAMSEVKQDGIIVLTNADTCLFPEAAAAIRREMNGRPCICSGRIDVPRCDHPFKQAELSGRRIYVGTDVFAFTPSWWNSIKDDFPDMLLACEGWDFVLWKMMERTNPSARLKYALCYHEMHQPYWIANLLDNPGQQHNRKLGREWAYKFGFERFLDDGRFLFRSTPRQVKQLADSPEDEQPEVIMEDDRTSVPLDGEMARMMEVIISRIKPQRIIETGTFHGTGTTRIVLNSLKKHLLKSSQFVSIECNADHLAEARKNLDGEPVELLYGLSVPRKSLPSKAEIEAATVRRASKIKYVDHDPQDRAERYYEETDYPDVEDDLIGKTLAKWKGQCDLAILDSAGISENWSLIISPPSSRPLASSFWTMRWRLNMPAR